MPIASRKTLRRLLGQTYIRDTYVGTTTWSPSIAANGSVVLLDRYLQDPTYSDTRYQRAAVLVASVAYRVASFNYQSGSLVTGQTAINTISSGMDFEIHEIVPPADKDLCIDDVVRRLRVREELPINVVDGRTNFSLGYGVDVLDAYYFADPTNSLNRDRRDFTWKEMVRTASGPEFRIDPPMASGMQLVLDAILTLTLGAGDAATINIPDERMVAAGAAAMAYWMLRRQTPGQESSIYKDMQHEAAKEFSRLAAVNKVQVSRTVGFDTPVTRQSPLWWVD